MDLAQGTRLGPYEIVARLGAGGMGEVYRARDTRLDRSVAIKVLPSELANDTQLKLRFEREARAISQLNHPHICTLHDVGDGYLVMELLEGETLGARIARGPMPPADVLRYGAQIADALHRAHRAGIVHRDLKPANVMLTKAGAKLLDFGLAKPSAIGIGSEATTMHGVPLTEQGTILGTFHYMAPEQLEGLEADGRTDIFALGAVLYEMTTGKRAFDGSTKTSVIAAIVTGQPTPIGTLQPLVPAALEHLVQQCMEKDPDDRWQSAHDVANQMRWLASSSSVLREPIPESVTSTRRVRRRLAIGAAILAAALTGALIERSTSRRPPTVPRVRYVSSSGQDSMPAASPDGKSIAFVSSRDGTPRIWIKQLEGGREIAITDGPDVSPRFSPDGSMVLFARGTPPNTLYRVPSVGGEAQKVVADALEGEWSPDGNQIAFTRLVNDKGTIAYHLMLADARGGNERRLHSKTAQAVQAPRFSPGGRTIAVAIGTAAANVAGAYELIDMQTGKVRPIKLTGNPATLVWLSEEEVVYGHIHTVTGVQSAGAEIVRRQLRSGDEEILLSVPALGFVLDRVGDTGLILETPARRANIREIPLAGGAESIWRTRGNSINRQPAVSPDGEWLIFSSDRTANLDLWCQSRKSGVIRRLTDDASQDWDPQFTPDGKHILWSSNRSGHFEIWRADTDGSYPRQVSTDGFDAENPTQAPGGEIYYASSNPSKAGLWQIRTDGTSRRLVEGNTLQPEVSPDGNFVTYHILGAEDVVYVVRVQDGQIMKFANGIGAAVGVSIGRARWMPDGKALVFIGIHDGKLGVYRQPFEFGRDTQAARRAIVGFDGVVQTESLGISPDGSTLLVSQVDDLTTLTHVENLPFPPKRIAK